MCVCVMYALLSAGRREEAEFEISADLGPTQWLGVGFSERGQLEGADLCLLWVDWRRRVRIQVGGRDGTT